MTDPGETRGVGSRMSGLAGLGLPEICAVCGVGMLVLSVGILVTCWRMIDLHDRQQQAQLKVARSFHVDLIRQMQALVGHSAASVTSDLCRVRFRLRLPQSEAPPAGSYVMTLQQNPGPDEVCLESLMISSGEGQIADFGMLSPGRYRLMIQDDLAMRCSHEFTVEPGAPVDRVVYCPDYEFWMFQSEPARFRLRFDWPALWESRPIVAVVHLRSGVVSSNGWHWQPPEAQQFDACVCLSREGVHGTWDSLQNALPKCLAGKSDVLPVLADADAQPFIVVPYACCEVYGVSFLLEVSDETAMFHHLGTFLYDEPDRLQTAKAGSPEDGAGSPEDGIVMLSNECCRQVCPGSEPVDLPIPLPNLIVPFVLHVAEQTRPAGG